MTTITITLDQFGALQIAADRLADYRRQREHMDFYAAAAERHVLAEISRGLSVGQRHVAVDRSLIEACRPQLEARLAELIDPKSTEVSVTDIHGNFKLMHECSAVESLLCMLDQIPVVGG